MALSHIVIRRLRPCMTPSYVHAISPLIEHSPLICRHLFHLHACAGARHITTSKLAGMTCCGVMRYSASCFCNFHVQLEYYYRLHVRCPSCVRQSAPCWAKLTDSTYITASGMGDYCDPILALAEDERWRDGAIYVMPSAMTKVKSVPSRSSWNSAGSVIFPRQMHHPIFDHSATST
ncbi:hypothetical protein BKA93DRAFT_179968 [Sparassis latifolia]